MVPIPLVLQRRTFPNRSEALGRSPRQLSAWLEVLSVLNRNLYRRKVRKYNELSALDGRGDVLGTVLR
jgi:hypothetical protein